ncbi:MAG TPA: hypothetical protein EYG67_00040 [Campylobacterales bacterium]|nr:hypothetical protein [Campylobacterales bacterium]HIP41791.1 hypothetical protein [Campylobacterales bacterium]
MNYWLVRAKWDGIHDKTTQFIQNDEWINGYDNKYLDTVNRVQEGDVLLLADNSLINYYGICVANENDGKHLLLDNWKKFKEPIIFPAKGAYIKTIVKVNDSELEEKSKFSIEELKAIESIVIKSIYLSNFTLFKEQNLHFSSGINIIIGENGTGKTQLLKLLYSLIQSNNFGFNKKIFIKFAIDEKLKSILKPEYITNLITKGENKSLITLDLDKYKINYSLTTENLNSAHTMKKYYYKKNLFLPAKEMLSFYTGFRSIYNQTSFDEIFDNLANHLGRLVPKNRVLEKFEEHILQELEEVLDGKIILENDRFYLLERDRNKREITLVAEGARKLGTIFHLLANGTIEKGSVLFWDEPESNLNPKFIRYVAKMLLSLEQAGIQIFIATHSLFLIKEIEILRKKEHKIKYFSFGFDENSNLRVSQNIEFDYLEDLVILDEELDQDDRLSNIQTKLRDRLKSITSKSNIKVVSKANLQNLPWSVTIATS